MEVSLRQGRGWWTVPPALSPCPNLEKVLKQSAVFLILQRLLAITGPSLVLQRQSIFIPSRPDLAGE